MNIGSKIRGFRVEKGLTTFAVAEELGVSEPTYRRYENDKSFPDIAMIDKMAKVFEKNFLELLPKECLVENSNNQNGGVVVNLGTVNELSEKLVEQYEERIKELKETITELKQTVSELKKLK